MIFFRLPLFLLFSFYCSFGEDATIAFVLAEREYDTVKTVPAFYESELKPLGFRATYVIAPDDGDGRNDFLTLDCIHPFKNDVELYDRWGNIVFQSINYDGSWTGLKKNKQVPDGGYFYIIKVVLPTGKRTFKGSLTIIR